MKSIEELKNEKATLEKEMALLPKSNELMKLYYKKYYTVLDDITHFNEKIFIIKLIEKKKVICKEFQGQDHIIKLALEKIDKDIELKQNKIVVDYNNTDHFTIHNMMAHYFNKV